MNLITNTWSQRITMLTLSCRDVKWIATLFGWLLKRILLTKKREPCIIFSFCFTLLRTYLTFNIHSVSQLFMWIRCRIRDWVLRLQDYQPIFYIYIFISISIYITKLLRSIKWPQDWIWFHRLIMSTNGVNKCLLDLKNQIYMLSGIYKC